MRTRILWYKGKIQVGDVVTRKIADPLDEYIQQRDGRYGIVVGREMVGDPIHPCVIVSWSESNRPVRIAESYVEVVCEKDKE